jgi:hypothetical protein
MRYSLVTYIMQHPKDVHVTGVNSIIREYQTICRMDGKIPYKTKSPAPCKFF